jgi:hypothetical protein
VLEEKTGLSKAALLRNSIKIQKLLYEAREAGDEIILHNKKTDREREVILV